MSIVANLQAYDAALKSHYTRDRVIDMTYRDNPFLAMVPKMTNFGGRDLPIPIIYGNPQGRSRTFANAKSRGAATSSKITDFLLTRVHDYGIATLDNETLLATKGDANAFLDAFTTEVDGIINSLSRSLAINLFRDSSCAIGQVAAEPTENASTFVVKLKQPSDVTNFEVDQMIVIYSAKSGGSVRSSDGTDDEWVIAAVDRDAGELTLTGTYSSSGTIDANDYIFVEGDRGLGVSGFMDWIPDSAPGATSYFGVNRSVDPTRLGGHRLDATGLPIEEALIEADSKVCKEGFKVTHFFLNNKRFGDLKKSLGSKVQYVDVQVNPRISFRGVLVEGEKGPIQVIPDQNCQYDRIWGVNMEYVKLYSLGDHLQCLDTDGLKSLRMTDDDGIEVRYGNYLQLGIRAPGSFINVQV